MAKEMAVGVVHSGRRFIEVFRGCFPSYGVVMVGRGALAIPLPMAKLGCGGWL